MKTHVKKTDINPFSFLGHEELILDYLVSKEKKTEEI